MCITKLSGGRSRVLLDPGLWPSVDDQALHSLAVLQCAAPQQYLIHGQPHNTLVIACHRMTSFRPQTVERDVIELLRGCVGSQNLLQRVELSLSPSVSNNLQVPYIPKKKASTFLCGCTLGHVSVLRHA